MAFRKYIIAGKIVWCWERIGYEYQFYCVSDIVLTLKMSYYEEAVLCWLINPGNFIWTSYNTEFP